MKKNFFDRRGFLKNLGKSSVAIGATPFFSHFELEKRNEKIIKYDRKFSANDKINVAAIGVGVMGWANVNAAVKIPGVHLVAACDLYKGRLERAKEVFGSDLFTTQDYHEILENKEIDAVIISTSDNWHSRITIEALEKGKHVYCEKPMVHRIEEGEGIIKAQKASKKVIQIGSQSATDIIYKKAKEIYESGEIGKLNMVNAIYDRQSSLGAWQYTIPEDANVNTIDWNRYIEGMGNIPFDELKFFRWRNYREFGTGVAGDLFVHLLTGTHLITSSNGPSEIMASGQLSYWKDGRNVPDVMTGILKYDDKPEHPAFQLTLQVNFISGTGGSRTIRIVGSEGTIQIEGDKVVVHHSVMPKAPGIGGWDSLLTFPKAAQEDLMKKYNVKYSKQDQKKFDVSNTVYKAPEGIDRQVEHHLAFFDGIRMGTPVIEDAIFGLRAAAPALACNESYFNNKIMKWDPVNMKVIG